MKLILLSTIAHIIIIMILQIQFIPETNIAKSIAIAWYAILNKVSRDTGSDITLKKYCNTDSKTEKVSAIL